MGKGNENSTLLKSTETSTTQSLPKSLSQAKSTSPNETLYSWEEVEQHSSKQDCWVVINDFIFNLTNFKRSHPGGAQIIDHFAGQDATVNLI